ncbi:hypothetical protein [Solibacillus sp. CAU 1738]|uniref:hypothetical protein n=1 Tax=Solibacillus sp. CAU 1738 TaxID=3140363 RepID=UPI0032617C6F
MVDLSVIIMIVGILCIIISFFLKDSSKRVEKEVEELSISIYQETNNLKRRLKIVEEELLLEPNFQVGAPKKATTFQQSAAQTYVAQQASPTYMSVSSPSKPINSILISQVLELNKQGLAISEISKLSTLAEEQVLQILATGGH